MKASQGDMQRKLAAVAGSLAIVAPWHASAQESALGTMVVTASRTQEAKRELSSNVTIIGEEEIKASAASTMADLMAQQGFMIVTTGDTSAVQIRGFGNLSVPNEAENTVLTLINGRRVGNANLAIIGLANVERVEIIRGPSAVQYGSSAMGGVINIITKRGTEDKPFFSAEAGIGSDDLSREKIAFGGAVGGFDYALGLTNFRRDDVTTSGDGRWYHTDISHNTAANVDLGYTFARNHRIGINYNYGDIESTLPKSNGGIRPYSGNTPNAPYAEYKKENRNTALTYTGSTDDKLFDWSASYSSGRDERDYISSGYSNLVKNRMANAQAGYNGERFSLSVGVDSLEYKNSGGYTPTKSSMEDTGAYFAGKLRLLDERLILSAGGRYDTYTNKKEGEKSQDDDNVGGSVGVAWIPVDGLKLRTNYAEGFKMPSPVQLTGSSPYYAANPDLQPEKSKTWEIGIDAEWKSVVASLTYFHSDWENKIIGMAVTGLPRPYQYQNIKDATLAGVEGSVRADLGKAFGQSWSLSPYLGFTWLGTRESKDETQFITYHGKKDDTLPNTPEWMFSYGLDYAHPGYKLRSRVNANTYGTLLTRDWSQSSAPYIKRPSGTVVNVSLEKELVEFSGNYGALTLRTEINNLFDGKNEMYWGYPDAGRSFYVGLRYDFK